MDFIVQTFKNIDYFFFKLINQVFTNSLWDQFFPFITDMHKSLAFKLIVPPLVLIMFILRRGRQGFVIFSFLVLALAASDGIGTHVFKKNIKRFRPSENSEITVIQKSPASGYSFISNHAANTFTLATFISAIFPVTRWPLFIMAGLVAYSRVYNGVHYPSDIMAGILLGILIGFIFFRAYVFIGNNKKKGGTVR